MDRSIEINQTGQTAAGIWGKYKDIGGKVFDQFISFMRQEIPAQQGLIETISIPDQPESNRVLLINAANAAELKMKADTDPGTGVWNRRHMARALEEALKSREEVHVAMMDLDKFKGINDTYSHNFGDIVLKEFTRLVLEDANKNPNIDFGRWGGEEFLVTFRGIDDVRVDQFLETARRKVEDELKTASFEKARIPISTDDREEYTVSIGSTKYDPSAHKSIDDLIYVADKALHDGKANGRNRYVRHVKQ